MYTEYVQIKKKIVQSVKDRFLYIGLLIFLFRIVIKRAFAKFVQFAIKGARRTPRVLISVCVCVLRLRALISPQ